jgi:TolB-like protein
VLRLNTHQPSANRKFSVPLGDWPKRVVSLAVLPFKVLSADPNDEIIAEGFTENLITELSQSRGVRVISHQSVRRFRETFNSIPEIARQLGVDVLVEGSIVRSGDRLRITANLVGAEPERHIWAQKIERTLGDEFEIEGEIIRSLAKRIKIKLKAEA